MDQETIVKAIKLANEAMVECSQGQKAPLEWTYNSDDAYSQSVVQLAGAILIANAVRSLDSVRHFPLYQMGVDLGEVSDDVEDFTHDFEVKGRWVEKDDK